MNRALFLVMSDFDKFKMQIRNLGGVWADPNHVYFTQFRDGYSASYRPDWPGHTSEDMSISYNWVNDTWRRSDSKEYNRQYDYPFYQEGNADA